MKPAIGVLGALLCFATATLAQSPSIPERGNKDFDSAKLTPKILGGLPAPAGAYPWQVSLQRADLDAGRGHYCGASIRNERWLVTAAHCMAGLQPSDVKVVAGVQTMSASTPRLAVSRIVVHKQFSSTSGDYDVAIVMLQQPLTLGPNIQPVSAISQSDEQKLGDKMLMVTGWGATQEGGQPVRTLREVAVPLVSNKECNDPLAYNGKVTDRMLCAGYAQGGRDSCQGDSGGPLATGRDGSSRLVGIVSWGEGCARPGKPSVYARVSVLNSWIEKCIASPESCQ